MIGLTAGPARLTAWNDPATADAERYPDSAALVERWRRLARRDAGATRADFDLTVLGPGAAGRLAVFEPAGAPEDPLTEFRCRLFGVALVAALGCDLTGRRLSGALRDAAAEQAFATLLRRTLRDAAPLFFTIDGAPERGALLLPLRAEGGAQHVLLFAEPLAQERRASPLDARPLAAGTDPFADAAEPVEPAPPPFTRRVDALQSVVDSAAAEASAAALTPETAERFAAIGDHLSATARTAADLADIADAFRALPPERYLERVAEQLEQRLLDAPNGPNAHAYRTLLAKAKAGRAARTAF
ncbi:MAG: hypothetical protein RIB45_00385 [Marivibrio sp.]|uniref:hypothetical protein n=1 Tax=Marivibrio sp. TaxID=2039719 RepID=UPI0032EE84C7